MGALGCLVIELMVEGEDEKFQGGGGAGSAVRGMIGGMEKERSGRRERSGAEGGSEVKERSERAKRAAVVRVICMQKLTADGCDGHAVVAVDGGAAENGGHEDHDRRHAREHADAEALDHHRRGARL